MKKTTISIAAFLYMTASEYNDHCIELYMRWCHSFAIPGTTDLQKLLANASINKYYNDQFQELEQQAFATLKTQHGAISKDAARRIYNAIMVDIFKTYPQALFSAARKLTVTNNLN